MTPRLLLTVLLRVVVRVVALSALVVAYDVLYGLLVPPTPDADIGRGLLAFLLVFGVAGLWGLVDGIRGTLGPALAVWVLVSVLGGLAWHVGLAFRDLDASVELVDLLTDLDFFWFTQWLVALPSVVGVALGRGLVRLTTRRPAAESAPVRTI